MSCGWMSFRNVREEASEEWGEYARKEIDHSTFLSYLHHSHPEREHTCETETDLKGCLGVVECGVDDVGKDACVAKEEALDDST